MSDHDLHDLFHDAVADVGGPPEFGAMAHRLRAVDRRRKFGVMVAGATAIVVASFGVASAWPDNQQPIQLHLGDESEVDQASELDRRGPDGPDADVEPAPDADVLAEVAEAPEQEEPAFVLDWGSTFDLADLDPEPAPEPTPHPTPVPQPPPAAENESGSKGGGHEEPAAEPDDDVDDGGHPAPDPDEGHDDDGGVGSKGEESDDHELTGSAAYGSCEEPIPYDIYSGSAAPGATVTVTSPYSATTSTMADASGNWSVQITFEAAPVGEPFTVTASSGGTGLSFGFTRTG